MAKLKLVADPTFKTKVGIPVAGSGKVDVEFEFKFRTRDEFSAMHKRHREKLPDDADFILEIASGWENEESFTRDNIELFLQNYHGAAGAIASTYTQELLGAKLGN